MHVVFFLSRFQLSIRAFFLLQMTCIKLSAEMKRLCKWNYFSNLKQKQIQMNAIENPFSMCVSMEIIWFAPAHGLHVKINYEFCVCSLNGQAIIIVNLWNEFIFFFTCNANREKPWKKMLSEWAYAAFVRSNGIWNLLRNSHPARVRHRDSERCGYQQPICWQNVNQTLKTTRQFIWFTDLFSAVIIWIFWKLTFTDYTQRILAADYQITLTIARMKNDQSGLKMSCEFHLVGQTIATRQRQLNIELNVHGCLLRS